MDNLKKYKWKYRLLLIDTPNYTNDNYKEAKDIYEKNIKEFHKRYVKFISNRKKDIKFNIKFIGFDGEIKKELTKINTTTLFKLIDSMPMSKDKGNLSLFSDYNKETTVPGLGFKDKEKALYTINKIKNKSIKYQVSLVNTMIGRAKNHPHQTKDMLEALKVFEKWLKDYKKNKKGGGEYKFIDIKLVKHFDKLAQYYKISEVARGIKKAKTSDKGFLEVFKKNSDSKKLKDIPIKLSNPDGANWYDTRNNRLNAKLGQMNKMKLKYFHEEGKLKGLPTKMHTILIMWAYSPFVKELNYIKKNNLINKLT